MNFGIMTFELVIGFFGLFTITKVLGKATISQVTPFEFVAAILLGEIVGSAIFDEGIKTRHMLYALFVWGLLIYGIDFTLQKWKNTRKFLEGDPSIVIRQGKLQRDVLKRNNLDINQLQHLLRLQSAFSIREVEYAILETDGQVSVMKKPPFGSPTMSDLELPLKPTPLPINLVIDGEVLWKNLKHIGKDEAWLKEQLKDHSIESYKEAFFVEYKFNEGIFVDRYE